MHARSQEQIRSPRRLSSGKRFEKRLAKKFSSNQDERLPISLTLAVWSTAAHQVRCMLDDVFVLKS